MERYIASATNFVEVMTQIGIIPENILPDSTEEKLFSKASDSVLSRAFRELGLKSSTLKARSDSADVIAESRFFDYTLVADAKAFRLSRTAKNQKDFKVSALSSWRKDNDFAVLCAPYFQYPVKNSQIYSQALENNVCLFSWEHLIFMLENGIKENKKLNLSKLWNFSEDFSHEVLVSDMKKNFLPSFNDFIVNFVKVKSECLDKSLNFQKLSIIKRSSLEKSFWLEKIEIIRNYSRKQAIDELIKVQRIHEKIKQIDTYVGNLS
ncbi:MAG: HindIII family type II restriction endonuclease [Synergistaceae bacterium]|nr:HindIII family type II restriction endonuclease [Synergistaceae bacterium]